MSTNKENLQQNKEDDTTSSENFSEKNSKPTVPNPFEHNSNKELSKEEMESIEQFKEAQTERD